jgi:phosphonopyruvate decarboxylase
VIEPAAFHESLARHGLTFFTGVPDSLLKDLCGYINDRVPPGDHVIAANEGGAVALAAGHYLATGRIPVVYLQNSGTGNLINPLLSLADPAVYAVPMLLLIGWRGEPGAHDEPQHVTQGRVQQRLMEAIEVPFDVVGSDSDDFDRTIEAAVRAMGDDPRPRGLLIRGGTFSAYERPSSPERPLPMLRVHAVEAMLSSMGPTDVLVSTTGMTSREVFALRERRGEGHERDFLTVGSMGHASQIALGLALARPDRSVYCLDGDGAFLMHMGGAATIGVMRPANLRHVVINNGAHDSVGGQPTAAREVDLPAIAAACGYRVAPTATSRGELDQSLAVMAAQAGPGFLEVRVASQARTDAGRPTIGPLENRTAFMSAFGRADG